MPVVSKYPTKQGEELAHAVTLIGNKQEATGFLRDLLTPTEMKHLSRRFETAKLLWTTTGTYTDIAKELKTTVTSVAKTAQWLYREPWQGYAAVLRKKYGPSKR